MPGVFYLTKRAIYCIIILKEYKNMNRNNIKILIVEDDSLLLNIYATTFEKENFEVLTAKTGEEGFELIKKGKPDIVLLDIMLPGKMDGLKVLQEAKKDSEVKLMPVIILSNLEDDKTISEGLKLGANGYFIKSQANPNDVLRNIRTILG
ncbi:response regulator [Candidatus Falkowbacteria bacterium]|nr:response regulator [Candidatus Falkowbacteria bacterium]